MSLVIRRRILLPKRGPLSFSILKMSEDLKSRSRFEPARAFMLRRSCPPSTRLCSYVRMLLLNTRSCLKTERASSNSIARAGFQNGDATSDLVSLCSLPCDNLIFSALRSVTFSSRFWTSILGPILTVLGFGGVSQAHTILFILLLARFPCLQSP